MDIHAKLLSYTPGTAKEGENSEEENPEKEEENPAKEEEWLWEGAPVFGKEHLIKVWHNGKRVAFSEETGAFTLSIGSLHDVRTSVLEIDLLARGLFVNESVGYCFKRVEELVQRDSLTVHYVKILSTTDPIAGWICCKECRSRGFKPKKMEFFAALQVTVERHPATVCTLPYSSVFTRYLGAGSEKIAGRLLDLQELFTFLFRDIRNFSELAYGGRELLKYYAHVDKTEFKKLLPYISPVSKKTFFERLWQYFRPSPNTQQVREAYGAYLKKNLQALPYSWYIESEDFYQYHLENYKYALSPYGQAFLSVHSMLNIVQKALPSCKCVYCLSKTVGSEQKFFHTFTGIPYEDIFHRESRYLEYVFFLDRKTSTFYIAFKGTLRTREALIDIDYKYYRYKGNLYHRGIFIESQDFFAANKQVIHDLTQAHAVSKIKLVGQSLGGALATLVCIFIKEDPSFSGYMVSSIGYSSPPIISNPNAYQKWNTTNRDTSITTVIYGNDIIPTLCLGKIFELRLVSSHLYSISVARYLNKTAYIRQVLKKLKKRGMPKLYIPGDIFRLKHTRGRPSVFLIRRTHWSELGAIKLTLKALLHHTPGAMINALHKSLSLFYPTDPAPPTDPHA
ncbi:hypothetical protein NEDG_00350 [Nematocida displodere]|uniref:sn-1-specific diacylglycerol lipase n=1 Tax=Nematocida displodere TaxID=1805483 RepID=A0A177EIU7_9MICR|nr:hypothetical protein NEDG_00350 [Nematocida displodere]